MADFSGARAALRAASRGLLLGWAAVVWVVAANPAAAATVTRGPYLQLGTPDSVVIRWRTDEPTKSRVNFGLAPGALNSNFKESGSRTEHVLTLTGLAPATRYYYSVGTFQDELAGNDPQHFFETPPVPGTAVPTRVWVLGDSGTADSNAMAVRDAYLGWAAGQHTDLWLMLGDNAYPDGTDLEYQAALFDMFPETLRQSVLWPTIGNHDVYLSNPDPAAYFDLFTLPAGAEAGGVASGTEAYYSFDHGNIHFVVLDSQSSDRSPGSAMFTWLAADLAATDRQWIVAFWHHPPYSKGSHDSDDVIVDPELVDMRTRALPILEDHGVDLVLSGHSHSYERSHLIDGHYDFSNSFGVQHVIDGGDGSEAGDGAYRKPSVHGAPRRGAVYTVAGSSGKTTGGTLDHPAMFVSLNTLGSVVLDVDGGRLDARFLDDTGVVRDHYTVVKDPALDTDFEGAPLSGLAPLQVDFTDRSANLPTSWAWDFDDDGFVDSTQQNPSYVYTHPGLYSVRLTVNGIDGVDEEYKQDYIRVDLAPPIADFSSSDRAGSVPLTVQFFDASTRLPDQWAWDFDGDGTTDSTERNPVHVYTEIGLYTVRLTASNAAGSDTLVRSSFIAVLPPVPDAVTDLHFLPDGTTLTWDPLAGACAYDLVRGDLFTLRATGGDHNSAALGCEVEDLFANQTTTADLPAPGEAIYYLVRGIDCSQRALTYDTAGIGQVASRDRPLQAAAAGCGCQPTDDPDGDAYCANVDNCPEAFNPQQLDGDLDGPGDACDNCPADTNAEQLDFDGDSLGDACDPDDDNDLLADETDPCPFDAQNDVEGDGFCGDVDNCPSMFNADQADVDLDGSGDICDCQFLNPNCNTDCTDLDADTFCVTSDCDDGSADIFPGAAPNDDPAACMKDVDGDDWGDDSPPAGVTPGSDCDDLLASASPDTPWYADTDGDGYGDPDQSQMSCEQPSGFVADAGDCDDVSANAASTFPGAAPNDDPAACMKDVDDDDWGDQNAPGVIVDGSDCNDFDAAIHPDTPWYADADGDGYGDPGAAIMACTRPDGYVADSQDCDDGSAATFPGAAHNDSASACMKDADFDNWGDETPPAGVTPGSDCNDADASLTPLSVWYADADGDGFGDPATELVACEPPAGSVDDTDDCDDGSAATFPGAAPADDPAACMKDEDGDGYGDDAPPAGVAPGSDCDDTQVEVNPTTTWYRDLDEDGYGDPDQSIGTCEQPTGYVLDGTDCRDGNGAAAAETFPGAAPNDSPTACMRDRDGDGWGDDNPMQGVTAGTDCDDNNASINPETIWWADSDNDGFGDVDVTQASCEQPNGYVDNDTDCDDDLGSAFPGAAPADDPAACMNDADDDDRGDPAPPAGIVAGSDCDDADTDNWDSCATCDDGDGDGFFASCDRYVSIAGPDCDDADAAINPDTLWYEDRDDDGYGAADSTVASCTQPDGYLPDSGDCDDRSPSAAATFPGAAPKDDGAACLKDVDGDDWGDQDPPSGVAAGSDCDDGDATVNPEKIWHDDADDDGFGNPAVTQASCLKPAGYVDDDTDCDDGDTNNWGSCATCVDGDSDNRFMGCDRYATILGPDCDDGDTNNWDACATCGDDDADGHFADCDRYLTLIGPDCDDDDTDNWGACATCVDDDGDARFAGCDRYQTIDGPDCDDGDTNNWDACATCVDADADSRFVGCDRYQTIDGPDCDDADTDNWQSCATCVDGDADTRFAGCDRYVTRDGPDCDDGDTNNWSACATCMDDDADARFAGCDRYQTIDGPDCDDGDTNNWDACATCVDADADSRFVGCDRYQTIDGPDCDDADTNNWDSCGSCVDTDADTYFTGCDRYQTIDGPDCSDADTNNWDSCATCVDADTDTYFTGCDRYQTINGPDCSDADTNNWDSCATCVDSDADTYFTGCDRYQTINGPDCSDADTNNWDSCAACVDADADTYFAGCDRYLTLEGPDCDDGSGVTFPGAAPNDSVDECMTDFDGDDWGDATPLPGVTPGTDCNDADPGIFPGAGC